MAKPQRNLDRFDMEAEREGNARKFFAKEELNRGPVGKRLGTGNALGGVKPATSRSTMILAEHKTGLSHEIPKTNIKKG